MLDRHRAIFEQAAEAMVLFDPKTGEILEFNDRAHRELGYTRQEFEGLLLADVEATESAADIAGHIEKLLQEGSDTFETKHRKKNGELCDVLVSAKVVTVHDTEIISSIFRDITDRKRAERALRESEVRFRELFNHMSSGVAVYRAVDDGRDFAFVDFNRGGERTENIRRVDVIGKRVTEAFPGVEEFGLLDVLRRVWRSGKPEHHPIRLYRDERVAGWRDNYVYRLPSEEVVAVYNDVTERKRAEEAIRRSEERFRRAAQSVSDLIYEWNVTTDRLEWLGDIDGALGFGPGEFPRTLEAWIGQIHPDDQAQLVDSADRHRTSAEPIQEEYRILHKDGTWRYWIDRGTPELDGDGRPSKWVGACIDITDRRRAEEQRQQYETQLRQADKLRAIGQLAAGMAHDVNSLLMVILGNVELLQRKYGGEAESGESADAPTFGRILSAIERGRVLIQSLLVFGRAQKSTPQVIDPNSVIAKTSAMLQPLWGEHISVEAGLSPDVRSIRADAGHIGQVVMNLLMNARDAMPNGGTVTIETANSTLNKANVAAHADARPGDYVMIAVSDTGLGLTEQESQRLFDPFFSTKPVGKGTGMGLAVVHGIVTHAGGHIEVESELGKGTAFRLYFPAVE